MFGKNKCWTKNQKNESARLQRRAGALGGMLVKKIRKDMKKSAVVSGAEWYLQKDGYTKAQIDLGIESYIDKTLEDADLAMKIARVIGEHFDEHVTGGYDQEQFIVTHVRRTQ